MFALVKNAARSCVRMLDKIAWSGPLIVRLTVGLVFVVSGWGKLHNLEQVTGFFTDLGIPAPGAQAAFVSSVEFIGGLLIITGLATRVAAALLIGVMAVAIGTAKWPEIHGVADLANTIEMAYLAMFVWLLVQGGGALSLDRLIDRRAGPLLGSPLGRAAPRVAKPGDPEVNS
jgi:putative oxidoreductase